MMKAMVIGAKDLRAEFRAKEIVPAMLLLALALMFLFTFVVPQGSLRAPVPPPIAGTIGAREATSVFLWSSLLFASIVGFGRSASLEREGSRMDALVLAPVDPAWIFAGKVFANFSFLYFIELIVFGFLILFVDISISLIDVLPVTMLTNLGLASVGTLFGTATQYTRAKELLLPLLIFPTVLPLLLGAMRLTTHVLVDGRLSEVRWFILMAVYDIVFLTIGAVTYEFVIRE